MAQILYPYLVEVSLTVIVTLVLLRFFVSGGVARNAAARFALGTFGRLLGLLSLWVFFSEEARQTDVPCSAYYQNGPGRNAGPPFVDGPVIPPGMGMGRHDFLHLPRLDKRADQYQAFNSIGSARHRQTLVSPHQQSPKREGDHA